MLSGWVGGWIKWDKTNSAKLGLTWAEFGNNLDNQDGVVGGGGSSLSLCLKQPEI